MRVGGDLPCDVEQGGQFLVVGDRASADVLGGGFGVAGGLGCAGVGGLAVRAVVGVCDGEVDRLAGGLVQRGPLAEQLLGGGVHLEQRGGVGHLPEDVDDLADLFAERVERLLALGRGVGDGVDGDSWHGGSSWDRGCAVNDGNRWGRGSLPSRLTQWRRGVSRVRGPRSVGGEGVPSPSLPGGGDGSPGTTPGRGSADGGVRDARTVTGGRSGDPDAAW